MRVSTRTLGLTAALLLLTCLPGVSRAADASVCAKFMWMDWGSYRSYYAIYYPDGCSNTTNSYPANYDATSLRHPLVQNCSDCEDSKAVLSKKGESGPDPDPAPGQRMTYRVKPGTKLSGKVQTVHHAMAIANPHWLKRVRNADETHWVEFQATDMDGNPVKIRAVLQIVKLERKPQAPSFVPNDIPAFTVGREVDEFVIYFPNGRQAETPVFAKPERVTLIGSNHLIVEYREQENHPLESYTVVTSTDIKSVP